MTRRIDAFGFWRRALLQPHRWSGDDRAHCRAVVTEDGRGKSAKIEIVTARGMMQ